MFGRSPHHCWISFAYESHTLQYCPQLRFRVFHIFTYGISSILKCRYMYCNVLLLNAISSLKPDDLSKWLGTKFPANISLNYISRSLFSDKQHLQFRNNNSSHHSKNERLIWKSQQAYENMVNRKCLIN